MAEFNVDTLNYEQAHRYYLAYYTGSGSVEMQNKGKEVAKSEKWESYITKWQSEDSTIYDLDGKDEKPSEAAQKEIDNLHENGEGKDNTFGAVGAGIMAAGGAALAIIAKTVMPSVASTGNILAAGIYATIGTIYAIISEVMRNQAKQNREVQEKYIAKAEKDLAYDYATAESKAQDISSAVSYQNEYANQIIQKANGDVGLANAVADATQDSNMDIHISALGQGDSIAGAAYDEISDISDEMLESIAEYDQILAEVNTSKSIVNVIKDDMPKFKQQRTTDKIMEYLFAAGGIASVLGGVAGISAAMAANILPPIAAGAIILFAAGIILFGLAAGLSMGEATKQKQGESNAENKVNESNDVFKNATNASNNVRSQIDQSNLMYQNNLSMMNDMDEEDANMNGKLV